MNEIKDERQRELIGEGFRLWDLKRWGDPVVRAPYGVVDLILCSFYYEGEQGYLDPNTASVWEFSEDGLTVTLTNGVFIGFAADGGYYNFVGSVHDTGTVGNRQ